jgi:NADH:ubiquinone oxidoreductase subunit 5 (subunit L)/multisubunit Na+/H+ antiporter MnhA subunit
MIAGGVDHATGTRDVAQLGGLRRAMPLLAAAAPGRRLLDGASPPMLRLHRQGAALRGEAAGASGVG